MVVFTVKLRDFVDQASANRFLENGGLSDVQATGSKPFAIRISRSGNRAAAEEFLRKPDGHHLAHHDVAFIAVDDFVGTLADEPLDGNVCSPFVLVSTFHFSRVPNIRTRKLSCPLL